MINMEHWWNDNDGEILRTRKKPCPSATSSTTNLTCSDLKSKQGLSSERPGTNHLSHGTALED